MSIPTQDKFLKTSSFVGLVGTDGFLPGRRHFRGAILLAERKLSHPLCVEEPLPLQPYRKPHSVRVNLTKAECPLEALPLLQKPRATSFLMQLYLQKRTHRRDGLQDLSPQDNDYNLMSPVHLNTMMIYDEEAHWETW